MRKAEVSERFYRLLYFSPRPEDEEKVCIGVLSYDLGQAYLDYDARLEKAHCFAPDYARESLSFVLEAIRDKARETALAGRIAEFSPQFQLSEPRALLQPVDEKVRSVLTHRYLLKLRSVEHRKREKGVGRRIDTFLSELFRTPLRFRLRRQVTAKDLFGDAAVREFPPDLLPKPVSRALISGPDVCLMDGADLHVESSDLLVSRVNRVAHAFWQYKQAEDFLGIRRDHRIVRAAIVFDGNQSKVESSLKWRLDFALHQFEKDADITVHVGSPKQEETLRSRLKALLPQ